MVQEALDSILNEIFKEGAVFLPRTREVSMDMDAWHEIRLEYFGPASFGEVRLSISLHVHDFPEMIQSIMNMEPLPVCAGDKFDEVDFGIHYDGGPVLLISQGHAIPLEVATAHQTMNDMETLQVSYGGDRHYIPGRPSVVMELELRGYAAGHLVGEKRAESFRGRFKKEEKEEEVKPARKLNIPGVNC